MKPAHVQPMTLGNMRSNGMRTLAVWCLARGCNHHHTIDVSAYRNAGLVPAFGLRHHHSSAKAGVVRSVSCTRQRL
jgi:hypothetical protein